MTILAVDVVSGELGLMNDTGAKMLGSPLSVTAPGAIGEEVPDYTLHWDMVDTMPVRVSRTACCVFNQPAYRLHVVCGHCLEHVSHPRSIMYDEIRGRWSESAAAHPADSGLGVHNHDAVMVGWYIYCGGGSSGDGFYNRMSILEANGSSWVAAAEMPLPNLLYYAFETDGRDVYMFGGLQDTADPVANVYKYVIAGDSWVRLTDMPGPRRNPMTACVGDTVFVIGGMSSKRPDVTQGTVWKYSVSGNDWTDMGADSMPYHLGWGKAVACDGLIYVFGGYHGAMISDACWRFDPATGSWDQEPQLPHRTRSHGADIVGISVWVAGGYSLPDGMLEWVQRGWIEPQGIEEESAKAGPLPAVPIISLGVLRIPGRQAAILLDITGRKVMDLQPGENDIRHLAPGVYFVRRPETEDGRPGAAVQKVVIQR